MAHVDARRFARLLAAAAGTLPALAIAPAGAVRAACAEAPPFARPVAEAAARFALPPRLLHAVIAVESNYAVLAVSPRGAMGLMQIMPGTWAELRLRHALGPDPFDPCDNILAGAAYLRELRDRYGDPGFLAAYNAGPGRYEAWLRGARRLPLETLAYVDRVSSRMAGEAPAQVASVPDPNAWRRGALFAGAVQSAAAPASPLALPAFERADPLPPKDTRETIFVARTGAPK